MTGSPIEGCEEATSPPPLLTKEGEIRKLSPMFYPCQRRKNKKNEAKIFFSEDEM
jgi:hypothetical protein